MRRNLFTACICLFLISLALAGILSPSLQAQTPRSSTRHSTERLQPRESQNINQSLVRAILFNPKEASGEQYQVLTQADHQELQEAIQELTRSTKDDPTDGTAYYALGRLYYIEGKYKAATENFDQAIKLSGQQDDLAYYSGGLSYYKLNNRSTAIEYIEKAINLDLEGWLDWLLNPRRDPKPPHFAAQFNGGYKNFQQGDLEGGKGKILGAKNFFCTGKKPSYPKICRQVQTCMCSLKIVKAGCPRNPPQCRNIDASKLGG
jgi:tetratricopeptide (TPR) repeat protein